MDINQLPLSAVTVIHALEDHLTPERKARLDAVVRLRSRHVISIMENIYDRGNVSAVMRSSEAFGFIKMCLVDPPGAKFKVANRVTRGAEKWLEIEKYDNPEAAVGRLKSSGYQIWATDLESQHSIEDLDWSKPTAIVFGNEKDGVSQQMLSMVDGRFRIPMQGFSQSFNISVAAALIFYHAHQQVQKLGQEVLLSATEREKLLATYYLRCFDNPEALLRAKVNW